MTPMQPPGSPTLHRNAPACLHCGILFGRGQPVNTEDKSARPKAGDAAICIRCGGVSIYIDDGHTLRDPTEDELVELYEDEAAVRWLAAIAARKLRLCGRYLASLN